MRSINVVRGSGAGAWVTTLALRVALALGAAVPCSAVRSGGRGFESPAAAVEGGSAWTWRDQDDATLPAQSRRPRGLQRLGQGGGIITVYRFIRLRVC